MHRQTLKEVMGRELEWRGSSRLRDWFEQNRRDVGA